MESKTICVNVNSRCPYCNKTSLLAFNFDLSRFTLYATANIQVVACAECGEFYGVQFGNPIQIPIVETYKLVNANFEQQLDKIKAMKELVSDYPIGSE